MAEFANNPGLVLPAPGLDLEATLFCGQSFAWRPAPGGGYTGVAAGRAVWVGRPGGGEVGEGAGRAGALALARLDGSPPNEADAAFWRRYFALEEDYPALLARFGQNAALAACAAAAPGLRVLRQPFWEVLLSFILSQNNNIGRITGLVGRLRRLYGPALAGGEHGFPAAEALAALTADDLAPLGAGYRAGYLLAAARAVAGGRVSEEKLQALDDEAARELLRTIRGVGPKVADCVLLFGLGRSDVVPMDVWMKRAMAALFPAGLPACAAGSRGIAQQYVFLWARANLGK